MLVARKKVLVAPVPIKICKASQCNIEILQTYKKILLNVRHNGLHNFSTTKPLWRQSVQTFATSKWLDSCWSWGKYTVHAVFYHTTIEKWNQKQALTLTELSAAELIRIGSFAKKWSETIEPSWASLITECSRLFSRFHMLITPEEPPEARRGESSGRKVNLRKTTLASLRYRSGTTLQ